jgi:glycerophosphoryl diester phosphodiesterase
MFPKRPLLFGHRGAAGEAPENTLPAFQRAFELGLDGIELDVLRCRTGEVVAVHDLTLKRLAAGRGRVQRYSYAELQKLDVGSHFSEKFAGERIPRLEEVLDPFGKKMWLDLEIKGRSLRTDGIEAAVIRLLRERGLLENVILSSFNPLIIRRIRALDPRFKTGFNYLQDFAEPLRKLWFQPLPRPFSLHPQPAMVDRAYLERAHRRGLKVMPWGVNEPEEIRRLLDWGVDGLISDYPSRLRSIFPIGP